MEQAYDLNQPAIAVAGGKPGSLLSKASVDRSNVVLETIKCAESGHGIIIRMYESENALTKTNLVVEGNYNKAFVCNLLEEEEAELELKDGVVCVQLKPYEVVTVNSFKSYRGIQIPKRVRWDASLFIGRFTL